MVGKVKEVKLVQKDILKKILDLVYVQKKTKYYRLSNVKQIISLNETHNFSVQAKKFAQKNFIAKYSHYKHCFFEPFICPKSKEVKGVTVSQLSETTLREDKIKGGIINNNVLLDKKPMPLNEGYAITAAKKRDFIFDSNVGIESFKEYLNEYVSIEDKEGHILPNFAQSFDVFEGYEDYNILLQGSLIHLYSAFSIYKPLSYLTQDQELNKLLRKTATTFTNNLTNKNPDVTSYRFLWQVLKKNKENDKLLPEIRNENSEVFKYVDIVLKELEKIKE